LYSYLQTLARVLTTIIVITIATPWFVAIVVPLLWAYRWIQNYYVPSSRQLKRIESNLRSPVFSHFSETLDGVLSIRAFGQQKQFLAENVQRVQRNMRAYYLNVASNRWLAVRLESLGTTIVTSAGFLAVLARNMLSPGVAGLSISYAISVTQALNWFVRMTSDRETNIVSVERLREYIQQSPEPGGGCTSMEVLESSFFFISGGIVQTIAICVSSLMCHYNIPKFYSELRSEDPEEFTRIVFSTGVFGISTYFGFSYTGFLRFGTQMPRGNILGHYNLTTMHEAEKTALLLAYLCMSCNIMVTLPLLFNAFRVSCMQFIGKDMSYFDGKGMQYKPSQQRWF